MSHDQARDAHTQALLQQLAAGRKGAEIVPWPGRDFSVRVRVVADQDRLEALAAAISVFKRMDVPIDSVATHQAFTDEIERQVIARTIEIADADAAIKGDPLGRHRPLFLDAEQVRELVDQNTRKWLLAEINRISSAAGTVLGEITDEQFDMVLEAAKKKRGDLLAELGSRLLASCLVTLASRLPS
jgi:anion-transporting  ArsA/GET3 family ATPase